MNISRHNTADRRSLIHNYSQNVPQNDLNNPQNYSTFNDFINRGNQATPTIHQQLTMRQQTIQRRQDLSPVNIQNTIRRERDYENFFAKSRTKHSIADGSVIGGGAPLPSTTVIVFGLTIPQHDKVQKFTFEQLRKQVIQEILAIPARRRNSRSHSQQNRDQDDNYDLYNARQLEGNAKVLTKDPNLPYIEIQFTKKEDAERALTMNLREYQLNNVRFVIQVKMREQGMPGAPLGYLNDAGHMENYKHEHGVAQLRKSNRDVIDELIQQERQKGNIVYQVFDKLMQFLMPLS